MLTHPTPETHAALVALVESLFVNGQGDVAERLVLTTKDGRDLGGWCRSAIVDRLAAALAAPVAGDRDKQIIHICAECQRPLKMIPVCKHCDPPASPASAQPTRERAWFDAGIAAAEVAVAKVSAAGRPSSFALGLAAAGEAIHALFDDDDEAWDAPRVVVDAPSPQAQPTHTADGQEILGWTKPQPSRPIVRAKMQPVFCDDCNSRPCVCPQAQPTTREATCARCGWPEVHHSRPLSSAAVDGGWNVCERFKPSDGAQAAEPKEQP